MEECVLQFRWIKGDENQLDPGFMNFLRKRFSLSRFVETGTYLGDTAQSMSDWFNEVVTIEVDQNLHSAAEARFKTSERITCILGNSSDVLMGILKENKPSLIWLDAHYSGGVTGRWNDLNTPIEEELSVIMNSPQASSNIILIDDIRYFIDTSKIEHLHDSISGYPDLKTVALQVKDHYESYILGDVLLLVPNDLEDCSKIRRSSLLAAYTEFRCFGTEIPMEVLSNATNEEKLAISEIPSYLVGQRSYGLGDHYFLLRALFRRLENPSALESEDLELLSRRRVDETEDYDTKY